MSLKNYSQSHTTTSKKSSQKHGRNGKYSKPINNIAFWYDSITNRYFYKKNEIPNDIKDRLTYWDSILEFKVWQEILEVVPSSIVRRQVNIELLPKVGGFPAWGWMIDFWIDCNPPILVEAKGQWILKSEAERKCFIHTLRLLHQQNESLFNRLLLVGDSTWQIPSTALIVWDAKLLPKKLIELMQ